MFSKTTFKNRCLRRQVVAFLNFRILNQKISAVYKSCCLHYCSKLKANTVQVQVGTLYLLPVPPDMIFHGRYKSLLCYTFPCRHCKCLQYSGAGVQCYSLLHLCDIDTCCQGVSVPREYGTHKKCDIGT